MLKTAFLSRPTPSHRALHITAVIAFSALLALSAKIELPFWPVPMTLETLAVLGLAGVFGARLASAAVLLWLAEGVTGIPVFAGPTAGLSYFVGPTAGYLLGFLFAAVVVGTAVDRGRPMMPAALMLTMLVGLGTIYAAGATWLTHLIGWTNAMRVGIIPFIPADLTKVALAVAIVFGANKVSRPCH